MNNSIKVGKPLYDTNGNRVQAHGGSIYYDEVDNTYYFYGENKEFTDGKNGIWTWGVRAYRSKDLYNWEDCGLILKPNLEDEESSLNPRTALLDRPHIIYNKKTKKYVCWCKIVRKDGSQTEMVSTADNFLGPYTVCVDRIKPLDMYAGDFDLFADEDNRGYYFFEKVHTETIIADLTDDYTNVTGFYTSHFKHPYPPYVREATAHFVYNGNHYLITSGTTGYNPNPSEVAVSKNIHGPYTILGDPCPNDESKTTYHSQISSVFKVPGKKNLYIALGDRWLPEKTHLSYPFFGDLYCVYYSGKYTIDEIPNAIKELLKKYNLPDDFMKDVSDGGTNTSISDYVWLPLRFEEPSKEYPNGMVFIDWLDEWKIEDYE